MQLQPTTNKQELSIRHRKNIKQHQIQNALGESNAVPTGYQQSKGFLAKSSDNTSNLRTHSIPIVTTTPTCKDKWV